MCLSLASCRPSSHALGSSFHTSSQTSLSHSASRAILASSISNAFDMGILRATNPDKGPAGPSLFSARSFSLCSIWDEQASKGIAGNILRDSTSCILAAVDTSLSDSGSDEFATFEILADSPAFRQEKVAPEGLDSPKVFRVL